MSLGADRIPCFSSYKPCWSRLASRAITRMGGGLTSGTSTPTSIRLARKTRRKSRANTSICGPGSNGWCAAPSVFPKRSTCTIWSLGCSSIAMNLDEPYEIGSTPLRHLPAIILKRLDNGQALSDLAQELFENGWKDTNESMCTSIRISTRIGFYVYICIYVCIKIQGNAAI